MNKRVNIHGFQHEGEEKLGGRWMHCSLYWLIVFSINLLGRGTLMYVVPDFSSSALIIKRFQLLQRHSAGWCKCNTLDLYSGGAQFESRLGHRLSRQR
jgi:hypothetical protein